MAENITIRLYNTSCLDVLFEMVIFPSAARPDVEEAVQSVPCNGRVSVRGHGLVPFRPRGFSILVVLGVATSLGHRDTIGKGYRSKRLELGACLSLVDALFGRCRLHVGCKGRRREGLAGGLHFYPGWHSGAERRRMNAPGRVRISLSGRAIQLAPSGRSRPLVPFTNSGPNIPGLIRFYGLRFQVWLAGPRRHVLQRSNDSRGAIGRCTRCCEHATPDWASREGNHAPPCVDP